MAARSFGIEPAGDEAGRQLASELARNHTPIIWPTKRAAPSLVTVDRPTGLRHSSPNVASSR